MPGHNRLQNLLDLLMFLSSGISYSIKDITIRFNLTERTTYRYLDLFKNAGFIVEKTMDHLYHINKRSPYFKEISELLHFSKEEVQVLCKAIHSITDDNLLKHNLVYKLYTLSEENNQVETLMQQEHQVVINGLIKAIKGRKKVILREYHSANSNCAKDRIVEPFQFTTNFVSIWAYEDDSQSCKTFKCSRIKRVDLLNETWHNQARHNTPPMDVFRISGNHKTEVKLNLTLRACELLKEEYPQSSSYIKANSDGSYSFEGPVYGFEGVGRFVMGLCHEIKIIYPDTLKEHIKNKIRNCLN